MSFLSLTTEKVNLWQMLLRTAVYVAFWREKSLLYLSLKLIETEAEMELGVSVKFLMWGIFKFSTGCRCKREKFNLLNAIKIHINCLYSKSDSVRRA